MVPYTDDGKTNAVTLPAEKMRLPTDNSHMSRFGMTYLRFGLDFNLKPSSSTAVVVQSV
jgi:hypothetical protein